MRNFSRLAGGLTLVAALASTLAAQGGQTCPATTGATMPLKYKGGPTVAAITPCDLMTRLYIYADDSMMGRNAGTPDAIRATVYIERQVRALGLKPAGDNGTYFQYLPVFDRVADSSASMIMAGNAMFAFGRDFTATGDLDLSGQVIYGGVSGDTLNPLTPEQVQGKLVIVRAPAAPAGGGRGGFGGGRGGRGGGRGFGGGNAFAGAAGILTVTGADLAGGRGGFGGGAGGRPQLIDSVEIAGKAAYAVAHPDAGGRGGRGGRGGFGGGGNAAQITDKVAEALLGKPVDQAAKGDLGKTATVKVVYKDVAAPTRSVVAILPGTDPKLKNEYIVVGAHADHIGYTNRPVDHDSLKAFNITGRPEGADSRNAAAPDDAGWAKITRTMDSLRKIYPERPDSISNGADDDGSGSVSILEIAEAFAKGPVKPKRSLIFIWQMGEEKGLWGSQWFTNHPTVPRDSIIADLNMDMVGRGASTDLTGKSKDGQDLYGAENYLQLVGSRRLSTELGDIVEQVNKDNHLGFTFDYAMDANGHPQNIYCRSDHANYARYGIPVVFFTTGGHADYHQVTDEPQYIQYQHMAKVDQLVYDIALKVGNLDHKVVVDHPKPDSPFGPCQQ